MNATRFPILASSVVIEGCVGVCWPRCCERCSWVVAIVRSNTPIVVSGEYVYSVAVRQMVVTG